MPREKFRVNQKECRPNTASTTQSHKNGVGGRVVVRKGTLERGRGKGTRVNREGNFKRSGR